MAHLSLCLEQSDIRVISDEELDQAQEFTDAFAALSTASRIAFLGFGYAELNLRRLRVREIDGKATIYGTCLGMNPETIKKTMGRDILLCNGVYPCINAVQEWKDLI